MTIAKGINCYRGRDMYTLDANAPVRLIGLDGNAIVDLELSSVNEAMELAMDMDTFRILSYDAGKDEVTAAYKEVGNV